jgi:hypothetical protein
MMSWHKISLSAADETAGLAEKIREEFEKIFTGLCAPRGVRVYMSASSPASIYFSPEAARIGERILQRYNARPCPQPQEQDLLPLTGHPNELQGPRDDAPGKGP